MIRLENLCVIFNRATPLEKQALKNISLTIKQGSFVTLIGSNGSGKSTLLATLAGDILPHSGEVFFDNQNVSQTTTPERANLVARVFQDPLIGSCGDLSIEENLAPCFVIIWLF